MGAEAALPLVQAPQRLDVRLRRGLGLLVVRRLGCRFGGQAAAIEDYSDFSTSLTDSGSVSVNAARDGDKLVIAVADTGKGIPADEIDTIFDEYRQVKGSDAEGKGTGLGLSITKRFAELLGGTVSVVSDVGRGSTFTIRLPIVYREGR